MNVLLDTHGDRAATAVAEATAGYQPKLDFVVAGAQKCGTTALWEYLNAHPEVGMSSPKEVHLFDGPDYSPEWSPEEIDQRYARRFSHCPDVKVRGEATPVYLYFPEVASELQRYNPKLKLIVLLRDSAERAISHYYMGKARGREQASLWRALLVEPWRLRRCANPREWGSLTRVCSYRSRGLYSLQLRNLLRHFPRHQVLILRSEELLLDQPAVLRRVFGFLGVADDWVMPNAIVHSGEQHGKRRHPVLSWLLRLSYLAERRRARGLYEL